MIHTAIMRGKKWLGGHRDTVDKALFGVHRPHLPERGLTSSAASPQLQADVSPGSPSHSRTRPGWTAGLGLPQPWLGAFVSQWMGDWPLSLCAALPF